MVDRHSDAMDVEGDFKGLSSSSSQPLRPSSSFETSSGYFFQAEETGSSSTNSSASSKSCFRETKRACRCGGWSKDSDPDSLLPDEHAVPITSCKKEPPPSSTKMSLESLGSELICAICQQLFVEASTIECGHSFCRMCIENWLKTKLSCPICRTPVGKPPIVSVCLDRAVCVIVDQVGEQKAELIQELTERRNLAVKCRETEYFAQACLETLLQKAQQQGVKVVHISKRWSPREQQRFLGGIERHQGVAREAYCKVVGLTYEWVGRATKEELLVAASNVMLKDMEHRPKTSDEWKVACTLKLRCRLEMYIRYG